MNPTPLLFLPANLMLSVIPTARDMHTGLHFDSGSLNKRRGKHV
jgi:hypothetical protein